MRIYQIQPNVCVSYNQFDLLYPMLLKYLPNPTKSDGRFGEKSHVFTKSYQIFREIWLDLVDSHPENLQSLYKK